jgi:flagellar basal body rod protein FlgG
LTYRGQYKEWDKWFGLVTTLIGCVPEIGSAIKGVVKIIFKAVKEGASKLPLKKVMRFMNELGEGNVIRFLREFLKGADLLASKIAIQIDKLLMYLRSKVDDATTFVIGEADKALRRVIENIDAAYKLIPDMVRDAMAKIVKNLKETLDEVTDFAMPGVTRARNGARQLKEKMFKIGKKVGLERAAKEAGMDPADVKRLVEHCKGRDRLAIMRFTNPESLKYHGMKGYTPKPLAVKLKTSKTGPTAGLVVKPKEPMKDWERQNFLELTTPDPKNPNKKVYTVDSDGTLVDPDGNKIYGDHDVQSVHQKVEDGDGEKAYLQDQTNPEDSSTIADMNEGGSAEMYQHGANDNFMVKTDDKGKVIYDDKGKPVLATVEDMNAGKATLGRQPEPDEKFLVVDEEGTIMILESPKELEHFHKLNGMIWEYDPRKAIAPAAQAQAVMGTERALENAFADEK